jgi:hypothetical protein
MALTRKGVHDIAASFDSVEIAPHFEKESFRVKGKIFATLNPTGNMLCVKLTAKDQDAFAQFKPEAVYPVPNSWGRQGWTFVDFTAIPREMVKDILSAAYYTIRDKRLIRK